MFPYIMGDEPFMHSICDLSDEMKELLDILPTVPLSATILLLLEENVFFSMFMVEFTLINPTSFPSKVFLSELTFERVEFIPFLLYFIVE